MPLLIVLLGVLILIFLIVKLKLNTFVSLVLLHLSLRFVCRFRLPRYQPRLKLGLAVSWAT